jgi:hypothetical protein
MARKLIRHDFATIGDYVSFLQQPHVIKVHTGSDRDGSNVWNGYTKSLDHAVSLVETGWEEGAKKVADWSGKLGCFLEATRAVKAEQFAWDVVGDAVDVGKYLTGEPECWVAKQDDGESISSRIVSIRLNSCVSGALQADAIVARGVAVLVAVDLLESCGRRCEVIVSQSTTTHDIQADANIVVKRASEPVDLDRLAYAVAHPGFFRRLGFRFMEICGHSPSGCSCDSMSDNGKREGTVEIDGVVTGVNLNFESLRDHVLEVVKACGLDFTAEQLAEITNSTVN